MSDHPYTDPGDGRTQCGVCGKWVWSFTHSCKGILVTDAARARRESACEDALTEARGQVKALSHAKRNAWERVQDIAVDRDRYADAIDAANRYADALGDEAEKLYAASVALADTNARLARCMEGQPSGPPSGYTPAECGPT